MADAIHSSVTGALTGRLWWWSKSGRGKFAGNQVDFVRGGIDDVRVYRGALARRDVAALATTGHWPFDEGAGAVAADAATGGNPGTLTGGAAWAVGVDGRMLWR